MPSPCRRVGRVTLDALRLPDDTIVRQIPELRRLRCVACDRRGLDLEPIWPDSQVEPLGVRDTAAARWILVIEDANGQRGFASPLWSRRHAARFARDQVEDGHKVVRVETPTGVVEADGIAEWLRSTERS